MSQPPEEQNPAGENRLVISGEVTEISALRRTPSGVPVLGFKLRHASRQIENDQPRNVECELEAIVIGPCATMTGLGVAGKVKLEGFLAQKSLRNTKPVLHVERIEFFEGN
jgi:primosomal replication protein N